MEARKKAMTDVECPAGHNSLRHSCCAYLREARAKVNRLENELVTANLRASAAEILLAEGKRGARGNDD